MCRLRVAFEARTATLKVASTATGASVVGIAFETLGGAIHPEARREAAIVHWIAAHLGLGARHKAKKLLGGAVGAEHREQAGWPRDVLASSARAMWQAFETLIAVRLAVVATVARAAGVVVVLRIEQELEAYVAFVAVKLLWIERRLVGERDTDRWCAFTHLRIVFDRQVVQSKHMYNIVRQSTGQVIAREIKSNIVASREVIRESVSESVSQ
jgi:hypothetical protein